MLSCHHGAGAQLVMRADGDAALDAPGHVTLWSTNTSKQRYAITQLAAHGWGPGRC
jgi:3-oxoacyl-(acyl-carrier-protein) synthase